MAKQTGQRKAPDEPKRYCGDCALGSLYTLSDHNISTESKIIKALEAAEYLGLGVCRPFVLLNTNDNGY